MEQNINEQLRDLAFKIRNSVEKYKNSSSILTTFDEKVYELINTSCQYNPWHIPSHLLYGLEVLSNDIDYMSNFFNLNSQECKSINSTSNVGVLMREGSPLEGLSELIYLACFNIVCLIRSPQNTKVIYKTLLSLFGDYTCIGNRIQLTDSKFPEVAGFVLFDELNTTQKDYFSKYPMINLANSGCSLLLNDKNLSIPFSQIAESVCMYFGRSNRNLKILFIPEGFNLKGLFAALMDYSDLLFNNRYYNNYEYRKSAMIFNKIPFMGGYPVLITEDVEQAGYVGVLCIVSYRDKDEILNHDLLKKFPLINEDLSLLAQNSNQLSLSSFRKNHKHIDEFMQLI